MTKSSLMSLGVLLLGLGCDGSDGGGPSSANTAPGPSPSALPTDYPWGQNGALGSLPVDFDRARPLSSLSAAERATLCAVRLERFKAITVRTCEHLSFTRSWAELGHVADVAVCEAQRDECVAIDERFGAPDCGLDWVPTCGAPFGLMEQCEFDDMAFYEAYPTCRTVTDDQLRSLVESGALSASPSSASCDELYRLCEYFETESLPDPDQPGVELR